MVRGTLRYAGFPEFVKVLVDMGFLSEEEQSFLKEPIPWKEATKNILGASSSSENDLVWAISSKTTFKDTDEKNRLVASLKWRKESCTFSIKFSLSNVAAQSAFFQKPRSRQKEIPWIRYVLILKKRWLTRMANVIS